MADICLKNTLCTRTPALLSARWEENYTKLLKAFTVSYLNLTFTIVPLFRECWEDPLCVGFVGFFSVLSSTTLSLLKFVPFNLFLNPCAGSRNCLQTRRAAQVLRLMSHHAGAPSVDDLGCRLRYKLGAGPYIKLPWIPGNVYWK